MITGEIKSKIDRIWDAFWSGGISNPLTVIEQFSYLLFIKRLDELHTREEKKANRLKKEIENPVFAPQQDHLRWSKFKDFDATKMFNIVKDEVFPFIKKLGQKKTHSLESEVESSYAKHMSDAVFMIPTPNLLQKVVDMISEIPMEDRDTKGDLYEYLLSKLQISGVNGQFRTPKHIRDMMVELVKPTTNDFICDPACGTAGFLVSVVEYLRRKYPNFLNNTDEKYHFNNKMFTGIDFDVSMLRISSMNMMLHGVENPKIDQKDSLSSASADIENEFTLVLANPPFKGSIDYENVNKNLAKVVKTKKTELLFVIKMLHILKPGGRCAVIVPDGVLFGSSNAHITVRQEIVDRHKLEAVISMPSGVFKPYAGVSTGVLIFTKTNSGGTDKVWFYDMQADGYSLDDKRTELDREKHDCNNIPDIVERFSNLKEEESRKRTEQSFFVPVREIIENKYDLSINRYKEIIYNEVQYDPPKKIIAEVKQLETELLEGMAELESMIK